MIEFLVSYRPLASRGCPRVIWAAPSHDKHEYDACGRHAASCQLLRGPLPSRQRAPPLRLENTTERGRGDGGAPRIVNARQDDWAPTAGHALAARLLGQTGRGRGLLPHRGLSRSFETAPSRTRSAAWRAQIQIPRCFALKGSATTLVIERLRLRILGVPLPTSAREATIAPLRGRRKDGSKRPNVYSWCYADDDVWRAARGQPRCGCGRDRPGISPAQFELRADGIAQWRAQRR